jgi:hypothetical protein
MGRNSAEATKASLMRAVRARLTVLLACRLDFLVLLPLVLVAFAASLAGVVVFCAALFFVAVEAVSAGAVAEPPEDCPITGCTIMSTESNPARQRPAWRKTGVGESATFILPL